MPPPLRAPPASPRYVDGHVQMGIAAHLTTIDRGSRTIASFPELRRTPIVIGESDPEGCAAWKRMGSPIAPRALTFALPRQAVLVMIEWE